jgi:hypothetical protein
MNELGQLSERTVCFTHKIRHPDMSAHQSDAFSAPNRTRFAHFSSGVECWSGWSDSNRRSRAPKARALPTTPHPEVFRAQEPHMTPAHCDCELQSALMIRPRPTLSGLQASHVRSSRRAPPPGTHCRRVRSGAAPLAVSLIEMSRQNCQIAGKLAAEGCRPLITCAQARPRPSVRRLGRGASRDWPPRTSRPGCGRIGWASNRELKRRDRSSGDRRDAVDRCCRWQRGGAADRHR